MANEDNLIPNSERTKAEREEIARLGGIASGRARRAKKELKECLTELLDREYSGSDGRVMSGAELVSVKLFMKARDGDIRAFEVLRDTVGQKPVERIETVEISQETYDRVQRFLEGE